VTNYLHPVIRKFDEITSSIVAKICDPTYNLPIPKEILHNRHGAGFPDYCSHASKLFEAAFTRAMTGTKIEVSLVTSDVNTHISGPHNLDADWLFFNHRMTPADFSNAMAIRLGTLPPHLRAHPCTCDCGEVITNDADQIEHVFKCDKFTMHGHTARHNAVRDAIASLASSYGISAIREPKNFIYPTNLKRPDILFLTSTIGIATDVSIVSPTLNAGDQLKRRETEKVKEHSLLLYNKRSVYSRHASSKSTVSWENRSTRTHSTTISYSAPSTSTVFSSRIQTHCFNDSRNSSIACPSRFKVEVLRSIHDLRVTPMLQRISVSFCRKSDLI